jgi:hypothetical protein
MSGWKVGLGGKLDRAKFRELSFEKIALDYHWVKLC